ncbi:MAG: lactate utilization protein C [Pseudomonadota bacterium]|nr:lactate utilization protein C [Pseudomonadota bacterium]
MSAARENILGKVRRALGKTGTDLRALADAQAYIDAHAQGPRPSLRGDLVGRFVQRATDMESTVERIASRSEIPRAVSHYLDTIDAMAVTPGVRHSRRTGVCWPEFGDLDWSGAQVDMRVRPTVGDDIVGVTGVFCAIAETGTLVVLSGADTPTATTLLPETHIAVVSANRIVAGMEEAFALIRKERGMLPRAVNLISGPSRTGDIEQTIVLGAHGPYRVHILLVAT